MSRREVVATLTDAQRASVAQVASQAAQLRQHAAMLEAQVRGMVGMVEPDFTRAASGLRYDPATGAIYREVQP